MNLHGKVALITGGAVRVGKAIALTLADAGADIAFSYNSSAQAAVETAAEIETRGRRAFYNKADVGQVADVQALVAAAVAHFGRLDVLVNSASLWLRTPFAELNEAAWDQVYNIMVKGTAFCSQAAAPHLAVDGDGVIVNIVDLSAVTPFPNLMPHSAAKAGLWNLTQSLAMALARAVRVNVIAPGPVLPPPDYTEQQIAAPRAAHAVGALGRRGGCRGGRCFPAQAPYITGVLLPVDGGEHLGRRGVMLAGRWGGGRLVWDDGIVTLSSDNHLTPPNSRPTTPLTAALSRTMTLAANFSSEPSCSAMT